MASCESSSTPASCAWCLVISEQAGIFFESALDGMRGGRSSVAMCQDAVFALVCSISLLSGHHISYAVLAKTSLQKGFGQRTEPIVYTQRSTVGHDNVACVRSLACRVTPRLRSLLACLLSCWSAAAFALGSCVPIRRQVHCVGSGLQGAASGHHCVLVVWGMG
jgi:hypothetical protein